MKTSLSHLPENKQFEILRIAEIIKEVVNPEKIILFGSYAKGTYVEDRYQDKNGTTYEYISDYDFLVVTKDNPEKTYTQEASITDLADRFRPSLNLEIHNIEYINEGLEQGEYFFVDIISEGITLYEKSALQFSKPKELTNAEKKNKAQRYFDTWFPQSNAFLETSQFLQGKSQFKLAAFQLHQATECLFYSTLLVFTDYKPKTHNLWKLRKKSKTYSKELFSVFRAETDKYEKHLFDLLKRGYVDARYRTDYFISNDELSALIERISIMIPIVALICIEKINSYDNWPD